MKEKTSILETNFSWKKRKFHPCKKKLSSLKKNSPERRKLSSLKEKLSSLKENTFILEKTHKQIYTHTLSMRKTSSESVDKNGQVATNIIKSLTVNCLNI